MTSIIWFLVFVLGALVLAYQRVSLLTATLAYGGALLLYAFTRREPRVWMIVLWAVLAVLVLLNIDALRIRFIIAPVPAHVSTHAAVDVHRPRRTRSKPARCGGTASCSRGGPDWDKLLSADAAAS